MLLRILRHLVAKLEGNLPRPTFASEGIGVELEPGTNWVFPERVLMGKHIYIGPDGFMNARGGLEIQDHTIFGPQVVIMTCLHRYKEASMVPYDEVELLRPVVIERSVWIGFRATILPGVNLGEGSIVGAGAVVTKSFGPGSIIAGNPAVVIGHRNMEQYQKCVDEDRFYLQSKHNNGIEKREILDDRMNR